MVDFSFVLILFASDVAASQVPVAGHVFLAALMRQQPDTSKAVRLTGRANDMHYASLKFADAKPRWFVLVLLGHPNRVERRPDGSEVWHYNLWNAVSVLWFNNNGVCTGTYVAGGY
jgi:hypothetical protein